jgi:hypothetical protein
MIHRPIREAALGPNFEPVNRSARSFVRLGQALYSLVGGKMLN